MNERELKDKMEQYLSKYFHIYREVKSNDKTSIIDIIMIHKTNDKYKIGIEVKLDEKKRGKDLANWLKQSERYTTKTFGRFGKVIICTYPQITEKVLKEGELMHKHDVYKDNDLAKQNNINTFLGQFNIGELQKYYSRTRRWMLRIVFKGVCFWDERNDNLKIEAIERTWK